MSSDAPTTLFLLDDHEMVRAGLASLLTSVGPFRVVGQAGTVAEAREAIVRLRPDVALLDVRLPDGSGIELCRYLQSAAPSVRCALLTSFDEDNAAAAAVLAGAAGYFLKEIRIVDLAGALQRIAAGESVLDPAVIDRALDALRGERLVDPAATELTPRETVVRDLLLEGLSDHQIAERLDIGERSVQAYVAAVLGKVLATI